MRGGTLYLGRRFVLWYGLSPRARGNRRRSRSGSIDYGSIPACAGEPVKIYLPSWYATVYPRVRGGTINGREDDAVLVGLSPRARGNRSARPQRKRSLRSIPACAGEPKNTPPSGYPMAVYPRVRGGTRGGAGQTHGPDGLSPRARGNHGNPAMNAVSSRSIPACAGEPYARLR